MTNSQNQIQAKVGIDARGAVWYRGTGIGTYTYQLLYHLKNSKDKESYRLFWPGEETRGLDIGNREDFRNLEKCRDYWREAYLPQVIAEENIKLYHVYLS